MRQNQKRIDIIISIIGAILLWLYVINIANPTVTTTVRDVPVTIGGEATLIERGRALAQTVSYSTNVTVSGPRNQINKIKAEDISLIANVAYLSTGKQAVEIKAELPQDISLVSLQNSTVEVIVEEYVTAPKPVKISLTGAGSGQEITILSTSLTQVGVSGAASTVAKVAALSTSGDLSDAVLDQEKELVLALTPIGEDGKVMENVKVAQDSINVTAVVFQTKEVPLNVMFAGEAWTGAVVTDIETPKTILIKGPATELSQISEIRSEAIDIEGIYETTVYDIVPVLPEGVYLSETVESLKAKVVVSDQGELYFKYKPTDVAVKDLGSDLAASVSVEGAAQISLIVKGPVATLRTLAAGDVKPSVSAKDMKAGEHKDVPLSPNQDISGLTVTFEPGTVTLTIK